LFARNDLGQIHLRLPSLTARLVVSGRLSANPIEVGFLPVSNDAITNLHKQVFYGPGKLRTNRALLDTANPRTTGNRLSDWDPFGMHNRD
jgi:hypothetical protein